MKHFDFLKLKQTTSLPHLRNKFFITFLTTLITTTVNIARDSTGFIYVICRKLYYFILQFVFNENIPDDIVNTIIKNIGSIFVRCADVAVNVFVIFAIVDFVIGFVQNRIYSKFFKSRRDYLKELLWYNIIPYITQNHIKEIEIVSNDSSGTISNQWLVYLADMSEWHMKSTSMILKTGFFERVEGCKISKHYMKHLVNINFPAVYTIYKEEQKVIKKIVEQLDNKPDESYTILFNEYSKILNNYNRIINLMNENKLHYQIKHLFA